MNKITEKLLEGFIFLLIKPEKFENLQYTTPPALNNLLWAPIFFGMIILLFALYKGMVIL